MISKRARIDLCFIALLGALAACGGNLSNDDLEFLNALPAREDLEADVPDASARQALTGEYGQTAQPLSAGEPSQLYEDTKSASTTFNNALYGLLEVIERVRLIAPSKRHKDARVWGPWSDHGQPGFLVQLVMERKENATFVYRIEHRRAPAGEWRTSLEGSFVASGGVRRGKGQLKIFSEQMREHGLQTREMNNVSKVDISYVTDGWPTIVKMVFTGMPFAAYSTVEYGYSEHEDGSGTMTFALQGNIVGSIAQEERLLVESRWLSDGRGRADSTIVSGDGVGNQHIECWDTSSLLVFARKTWDGTLIGDEGQCADVTSL